MYYVIFLDKLYLTSISKLLSAEPSVKNGMPVLPPNLSSKDGQNAIAFDDFNALISKYQLSSLVVLMENKLKSY